MLDSLSAFFSRISSWKRMLLALALYVIFPAYILKNLEIDMNAAAGKAVGPIDLLMGYDPAKINQMVEAYGPEGRSIYARAELTADIVYPLVYTALFCIVLSLLFRNRLYGPFQHANLLPFGIWLFDLLENICIVYLLKSYPDSSTFVTSLCSILTNLKWAMTILVAIVALYGLVRLVISGRQRQIT